MQNLVITEENFLQAIEKELDLCDNGIKHDRTKDFKHDRELLKTQFREFKLCCKWLIGCKQKKTINTSISSYELKNIVEKEAGEYVSNGAFIAAVIHLEIPYKKYFDSPNIHIAISSKRS